MSFKREKSKGHYRWVVRNPNGTIKTYTKWNPFQTFPCEFWTCEDCPIDQCILKEGDKPE